MQIHVMGYADTFIKLQLKIAQRMEDGICFVRLILRLTMTINNYSMNMAK